MPIAWTRPERHLLVACAALCLVALFGPYVPQPLHAHDFADQRLLAGVPRALDVLSNLPFALAGAIGLWVLGRAACATSATTPPAAAIAPRAVPRAAPLSARSAQHAGACIFCAGLLLTAMASAGYHLAPDDAGLALDRAAMGVAFAGVLGLLVAGRVSGRAGALCTAALLVLAPLGVVVWFRTGNVLPWAVVQFGGMALLVGLLATTRPSPGALPVRWWLVVAAYAMAKGFEAADLAVYVATGELFSGHTVKHVVAALAAWPVIAALAGQAQQHNRFRTAAPVA